MQQFRPHPAKGYLVMVGISHRRVAKLYGCTPLYVGRVLNGRDKPPARFKAFLAELLDRPESELFHDAELVGGGAR